MPWCNVCGEAYDDGDWRCDGMHEDGTRCGADLVEQSKGDHSRAALGRGQ